MYADGVLFNAQGRGLMRVVICMKVRLNTELRCGWRSYEVGFEKKKLGEKVIQDSRIFHTRRVEKLGVGE